jgi:hypothetical protein
VPENAISPQLVVILKNNDVILGIWFYDFFKNV